MKRSAPADTNLLFMLLLPTVGVVVGFFLGNLTTVKLLPNRVPNSNSTSQTVQTQPIKQAINPNNISFETADTLTPGIETQSSLGGSDNVDFYKFNVDNPGRIKITFDHLPNSYQMLVYNPQKQVIAQTDRKGFIYSEGIVVAQDKGIYYIKVISTYQDPNSNPYTIRIAILPFFGE